MMKVVFFLLNIIIVKVTVIMILIMIIFAMNLKIFGCTDNGLQENAVGIINDQDVVMNYHHLTIIQMQLRTMNFITIIEGCTEEGNYNYNSQANTSSDCIPLLRQLIQPNLITIQL